MFLNKRRPAWVGPQVFEGITVDVPQGFGAFFCDQFVNHFEGLVVHPTPGVDGCDIVRALIVDPKLFEPSLEIIGTSEIV